MKKKIIAILTLAICGMCAVPGTVTAKDIVPPQSLDEDSGIYAIFSGIAEYMTVNGIKGSTSSFIKNGNEAVCIVTETLADAEKIKMFIEEQNLNKAIIGLFYKTTDNDLLVEKEESLMNIRGDVSQFIDENNINGYTYIKLNSSIITVVCETNEGIEKVKSFVDEKGYRQERLEYTLPDFEVNAPETAPTDLEEIRLILDDFIKQNGISGYTKIAPRKGEDKVWVMVDSTQDEYFRKIEFFMSLYGINADKVVIDSTVEVTPANSAQIDYITNIKSDVENYMNKNSISAQTMIVPSMGKDELHIMFYPIQDEDMRKVESFLIERGITYWNCEVDTITGPTKGFIIKEEQTSDISKYAEDIESFMNRNNISGDVNIHKIDNTDRIVVLCDNPEEQNKVRKFVAEHGINENLLYYDFHTYCCGDFNGDSIFDGRDATEVLTYYAQASTGHEPECSAEQKSAADVNKDSIIDAKDATLILSYYSYTSTNPESTLSIEDFINKSSDRSTETTQLWCIFRSTIEWNGITFNDNTEIDASKYTKDKYIGKVSDFKGEYKDADNYLINPDDSVYTTKENEYVLLVVKTEPYPFYGSVIAMTNPEFLNGVVYKPHTEDIPYEDVVVFNSASVGAVYTSNNVTYDEAKTRFGHPLKECTRSDFLGYKIGIVSRDGNPDSKETLCYNVTYEFANGTVCVMDQDKIPGSRSTSGVEVNIINPDGNIIRADKEYNYLGRTFTDESYSVNDEKIMIGYYPTGENRLAYVAEFDKTADINDIMDIIIETEITETKIAFNDIFKTLDALDYHAISCDGLPEYELTAQDGTVYLVNFDGGWVWRRPSLIAEADNEAPLTQEVIDAIRTYWDKLDIAPAIY